ncbi:nitroreductase family protein [Oribacterium sp. P6A1]|uniref:nitroreductase family protein n=1 Tax=Oribacterium sp. P6A1 TaxID=1410612 RepID=UPI0018CC215A|nr:nitroreductase family protein [Oribacterium sp. P6A1]
MCMPNPRPYGLDKVKELIGYLNAYSETRREEFEYQLGVSALFAWTDFFEKHNWQSELAYNDVIVFLKDKNRNAGFQAGAKLYRPGDTFVDAKVYEEMFLSRHSVRDYQERKIDLADVQFALKCFVETPTACNRQMCRVYYIQNQEITDLLNHVVIGVPGFNKKTVQYFLITYDLASFAYSGERQQGLFNAGLCTMNFINGLHAKGIGSCCLQWSNKYKQDVEVREKLGLRDSERIGIVVGAGYYLDENIIPCSVRRRSEDVFQII